MLSLYMYMYFFTCNCIYITCIKQTLLSNETHDKYICQNKEKHYIAVGTVKIFIESAKHLQLLG